MNISESTLISLSLRQLAERIVQEHSDPLVKYFAARVAAKLSDQPNPHPSEFLRK